jgi:riboflavin synthase
MFSGIVETTGIINGVRERDGVLECSVVRPAQFDDVKIGDSIALDGICLTLERFDQESLTFALGPETLRVTGWHIGGLLGKLVNLERSLRLNDRIHGHLVTGHVDALGTVVLSERQGEAWNLTIAIPKTLSPYIWSKGSVAINGVSLTVNASSACDFQVGLIPETLKRTNLGRLEKDSAVNLEIDNMARGLVHVVHQVAEAKK